VAKLSLLAGTTSKTVKIFAQDSSKTDGSGLTGLVFNSASLTAYYIREGESSMTAITLVTATLGTWTSGGFIVVDATHAPGAYELGIPNAALTGAKSVLIYIFGATNMVPVVLEIELTAVDNQSNTTFVASVPAVTGAVGSVTGNVGGNVVGSVGSVTGAVGSVTGSVGGNVVGTVASVVGNVGGNVVGNVNGNVAGNVTGSVGSVVGNVGGNVVGSVASVTAAVTTTYQIKKNTGLNNFEFLMTDATTGAPKPGLVVTPQRSLDGGALAAMANAVVEVGSGIYKINIAAADVNANTVTWRFSAAGANDSLFFFTTQT